tara:strand:+ start:265 stop:591 length:327 start_codon:yes stop_codon:yes gene_type:complete
MVQLLKLSINFVFYYFIKIYRLFFSRFTQNCIYKESCSNYALRIVLEKESPYNNFKKIMDRIRGCKVREIIKSNNGDWYILNGYNERVDISKISDFTVNQVEKSIKNN